LKIANLIEFVKNSEIYKYLIVGAVGAIIVILFTVVFTQGFGIYYILSAVIAFEISQIWGFFANDRWTFSKIKKTSKPYIRFIKYNLFSLISLSIIQLFMITLTTQAGFHYTISESIGIVVAFLFNFITSKKISFKN